MFGDSIQSVFSTARKARLRLIVMITVLTHFLGCAEPKYLVNSAGDPGSQKASIETCQAKFTQGFCVGFQWEKIPTEKAMGSLIFKTFRPNLVDQSPMELDLSEQVGLQLWMPSMGHGSSPVVVERLDVGTYRARNVFFPMKGDWELRFQLKNGTEVQDQAVISLIL